MLFVNNKTQLKELIDSCQTELYKNIDYTQ